MPFSIKHCYITLRPLGLNCIFIWIVHRHVLLNWFLYYLMKVWFLGATTMRTINSMEISLGLLELTWLEERCGYYPFQIRSVAQSCPTLCDPMNRSTPGLPIHHQLLEFTQIHVHQVSDAIQPSPPLSSPSPPAPNPSQHQSLFQWVNSSHDVAKVLEFQL